MAVVQAMYRRVVLAGARRMRWRPPRAATAPGCCSSSTCTTAAPRDGTWGNELEAFQVIDCMDQAARQTVAEVDAETPAFHAAAPRLVPADSAGGYACTFLPPPEIPRSRSRHRCRPGRWSSARPATRSTPLDSHRVWPPAEDGRLVVVTAAQHTGYGVNECVIDVVNKYLVDLEAAGRRDELLVTGRP